MRSHAPACLDDLALLAWLRGAVDATTRLRVDEHLRTCESCAELLAYARLTTTTTGEPAANAPRPHRQSSSTRYRIGPELARGGMGRIMAARDTVLNRDVALKLTLDASPALRQRFEREVALISQLEHPAIVTVYDAGELDDGTPYYAMRLLGGTTLEAQIAATQATPARMAMLPALLTIADALAYIHTMGLVHRDIKPANILLGEFGETVLLDWGLAKPTQEAPEPESVSQPESTALARVTTTCAGQVVGTPAYMAPEQARGATPTPAVDVYAFGVTMLQVLAGRLPLKRDPASLTTLLPHVPPELAAIVRCAMAEAPAQRYADGRALAADLRRYLTGQRVEVHRYSLLQHVQRWASRNRTPVQTGVLLSMLTMVAIAVGLVKTISARNHAEAARVEAELERNGAESLVQYVLRELRAPLARVGRLELLTEPSQRVLAYYQRAAQATPGSPEAALYIAEAQLALVDAANDAGQAAAAQTALAAGQRVLSEVRADERGPWQCEYLIAQGATLRLRGQASAAYQADSACATAAVLATGLWPASVQWRSVASRAAAQVAKHHHTNLEPARAFAAGELALRYLDGQPTLTREQHITRAMVWHDRAQWAITANAGANARRYGDALLAAAQA